MMGWGFGGYGGGGVGWFGPIMMIVFWGAVILGIAALVRYLVRPGGGPAAHDRADTALDILKNRYARGEINKEEFEAMRKDLS